MGIWVGCSVGALVEFRFGQNVTLADVEEWVHETRKVIAATAARTKRRVTICTDLRATQLFSPEVGDRIVHLMRSENPSVERNGVLGNGTALLTLQVQRLLSSAASSGRRQVFTQPSALCRWLDETLLPDERDRLRRFIDEGANPEGPNA